MATPSLLMAFESVEQLQREAAKLADDGLGFVEGQHDELHAGDVCELVLIHPETGESYQLDAKVIKSDAKGISVQAKATPLVQNQLRKFAGITQSANIHDRMRKLKMGEVVKLAQTGELEERVAIERMYGKSVWDALLSNPKLTVGEVIRLARNGTMPRPMLERIITNKAWVRVPQVRRALLTHRRLDGGMIQRVLNVTPPVEIKLIAKQTAYPAAVRAAANKLLGR